MHFTTLSTFALALATGKCLASPSLDRRDLGTGHLSDRDVVPRGLKDLDPRVADIEDMISRELDARDRPSVQNDCKPNNKFENVYMEEWIKPPTVFSGEQCESSKTEACTLRESYTHSESTIFTLTGKVDLKAGRLAMENLLKFLSGFGANYGWIDGDAKSVGSASPCDPGLMTCGLQVEPEFFNFTGTIIRGTTCGTNGGKPLKRERFTASFPKTRGNGPKGSDLVQTWSTCFVRCRKDKNGQPEKGCMKAFKKSGKKKCGTATVDVDLSRKQIS